MIIVEQLRAARAALRWSIENLSETSNVSVRTIKMVEASDGVPRCKAGTLRKLIIAYEAAGIEFIGTPEDGPGVRIRPAPPKPQSRWKINPAVASTKKRP
jgi:transcriptional regulator with XRE-family HTH domain